MHTKYKKRETMQSWAYIFPSVLMLVVFSVIPIFASIYLSFTKYNGLKKPVWIGLDNYVRLLQDPVIKTALINTFKIMIVSVPVLVIISLSLAAIIAEYFRDRFGKLIKGALFVPVVASTATIAVIWCMVLGYSGPVNNTLELLGFKTVNWVGSKTLTLYVICFINIWKDIGYFMVIFYAGIMDIPRSLYEVAEIDGANPIQKFLHITIPNLKHVTYLVVILETIWAFQEFVTVKVVTDGGPGTSTMTLVLDIYRAAFKDYKMGYACAISILLLVCVLFISFIQKKFLTDKED